jgi:hypothetical protein
MKRNGTKMLKVGVFVAAFPTAHSRPRSQYRETQSTIIMSEKIVPTTSVG